jgi:hypothetical protein
MCLPYSNDAPYLNICPSASRVQEDLLSTSSRSIHDSFCPISAVVSHPLHDHVISTMFLSSTFFLYSIPDCTYIYGNCRQKISRLHVYSKVLSFLSRVQSAHLHLTSARGKYGEYVALHIAKSKGVPLSRHSWNKHPHGALLQTGVEAGMITWLRRSSRSSKTLHQSTRPCRPLTSPRHPPSNQNTCLHRRLCRHCQLSCRHQIHPTCLMFFSLPTPGATRVQCPERYVMSASDAGGPCIYGEVRHHNER